MIGQSGRAGRDDAKTITRDCRHWLWLAGRQSLDEIQLAQVVEIEDRFDRLSVTAALRFVFKHGSIVDVRSAPSRVRPPLHADISQRPVAR
jgi:hypothetical protein